KNQQHGREQRKATGCEKDAGDQKPSGSSAGVHSAQKPSESSKNERDKNTYWKMQSQIAAYRHRCQQPDQADRKANPKRRNSRIWSRQVAVVLRPIVANAWRGGWKRRHDWGYL